jgi:hypothetical protein
LSADQQKPFDVFNFVGDLGAVACGYEGAVRDISALPPGVVSLNHDRHRG